MQLKLCQNCKRPFLEEKHEFCPKCPAPPNADSYFKLGCILLTILPLFLFIVFWVFYFAGLLLNIILSRLA